ncbi:hypothetical protein IY145_23600 [Methylosinus sp. H3A]|uniref:hypothetical protein n=1 Tax=Methylosinus sp. H3A TaxID=2785786 RepID=UPI0018C30BC8|nr:hypothetical protein [Methylosinus sp. H3A]MBG0812335.1 hypothetical protein [Methylosinus sp. H3A]
MIATSNKTNAERAAPTVRRWSSGLIARSIALLVATVPAHAEAPSEPACKADCVQALVNGLHLSIPRVYFASPPKGDGTNHDIFLSALLPDLAPATRKNRLAVPSAVWGEGWGPTLNMLIEEPRAATFHTILKAHLGRDVLTGSYPIWDGLETASSEDPHQQNDGFFLREDDKLNFIMTCTINGTVNFPACVEFFFYRNALVQLTFGRHRISDWRSIRDSAIAFIDRFTILPSDREGPRDAR